MKIGIVTIMDYTNYGNRLQNYAVYYILRKKFNCDVVSLETISGKPFCNGNYIAWLKEQIARTLCIFPTWAEKRFGNNITRWANFVKWSKRIPTKKYFNCTELPERISGKYDYFFAGSDQIWNYHFAAGKFYNYFLDFADINKRVALAASFGVDSIPAMWNSRYVEGLSKFSHISVREDAGCDIIKSLLGKEVPVLIDPTMILNKEEWLAVSNKPRIDCTKPYILKYYLGDKKGDDKVCLWAKENGFEIYELLNDQIPELYSAGPGEFITLISNAAMVCSDSFHCVVFSIIFAKPFVVYARRGKENYMSSRMETLLNKFGFQDRWENLVQEDEYLKCDFGRVNELMQEERQKFFEYVGNILE